MEKEATRSVPASVNLFKYRSIADMNPTDQLPELERVGHLVQEEYDQHPDIGLEQAIGRVAFNESLGYDDAFLAYRYFDGC